MCRSPTSSCSGPAGPRSVSGHAPSPARLSAGDTRSGSGPSCDAGVSRVASGACADCQIPSCSYRPFAGGLPHARRLSTVSRRVCSQTALCARLPHVDTDLRCGWGGLVQRIPVVSRKAACNRATTVLSPVGNSGSVLVDLHFFPSIPLCHRPSVAGSDSSDIGMDWYGHSFLAVIYYLPAPM